mmetsp:Transcript_24402/g.70412  ORF Transcript_24402/g.70412 Transcript_24402/m.70412 type:complete len:80 (-) Transcript_24402:75-314(-)
MRARQVLAAGSDTLFVGTTTEPPGSTTNLASSTSLCAPQFNSFAGGSSPDKTGHFSGGCILGRGVRTGHPGGCWPEARC